MKFRVLINGKENILRLVRKPDGENCNDYQYNTKDNSSAHRFSKPLEHLFSRSEFKTNGCFYKVLGGSELIHTITKKDVGKSMIKGMSVSYFMGQVLKLDIGKRIYKVLHPSGKGWIYQVENQEQLEKRINK